jgi:hypothetical protein
LGSCFCGRSGFPWFPYQHADSDHQLLDALIKTLLRFAELLIPFAEAFIRFASSAIRLAEQLLGPHLRLFQARHARR